jgi:hypothetical protein
MPPGTKAQASRKTADFKNIRPMQYNEPSVCPVCSTKTIISIQAYGDYDGPDEGRETSPSHCGTCKGIELANPEMWKRLSALYGKLLKERERHKKAEQDNRESSYSLSELYAPLHGTDNKDAFKLFIKRFKYYAAIHKKCDGTNATLEDEWVVGNAARDVGQAFLHAVEHRQREAKYPY